MRRASDTKSKILEVAEREFAFEGYAGAHLQKIAEQVGVQKTALYYHFESKSALYIAVLETMLEAFGECVSEAIDNHKRSEERLDDLIAKLNEFFARRPTFARILLRAFVDPAPVDASRLMPIVERVVGRSLAFYREGIDAGAFRRLSSRHMFLSVLGMTLFHYAAPEFGARVLGVDDIFADDAVAWRRSEVARLLRRGAVLVPPEDEGREG